MNETTNALDLIAAGLGLPPRFIAAWALAECGRKLLNGPPADQNWLNISPNGQIATYPNTAAFTEACRQLLLGPNALGLTLTQLQQAPTDADRASLVAGSAWASSHYFRTLANPGGTIWGCYQTAAYFPLFDALGTAPVEQAAETIITAAGAGTVPEELAEPSESPDIAPEPPSRPAEPVSVTHPTYTVRSGDTLWSLCRGDWTLINAVKTLNHIGADNVIQIGQVLTMPDGWSG
jgi:nucleoid-associated protein YgaU